FLDAPQNRRAKRVRDIEEHHSDAMASFAAKKTRHRIWPIAEFLGDVFNPFLCGWRDVPRQRRIVQDNGNRRGREAAGLRDVPHRDRLVLFAMPLHQDWVPRLHHHPSRTAEYATCASLGKILTLRALQKTAVPGTRASSTLRTQFPRSSKSNRQSLRVG